MRDLTECDVVREYGYFPVRDGARIAYVIWRPNEEGRWPIVLNYSAYAESGTPFDQVKRFLDAGYVYAGANVRGSGCSEGIFSYFQPLEALDGAELIEWLARQPFSSGCVGMIGASYGAHTQIAVAALRPPHLKAIVAVSTDGCEYRDEAVPGGLINVGVLAQWTFKIQPELAQLGAKARFLGGDRECCAIRGRQAANRTYAEILEHPLYDEWWQARSLEERIHSVQVPALFIQAWQDEWIRPNGAIRLFTLLKSSHKRLIVQNGPHRLSPYAMTQREQMRWLDRWVKDEGGGEETEPRVTVHWEVTECVDGIDAAPNWTTRYPDWPVPGLQWVPFYLGADGALIPEKPPSHAVVRARRYVAPLGTELPGSPEQFALAPHPLGELRYTSSPTSTDTVILGAPQLTLYFSADQEDTDFLFVLRDLDPQGYVTFLQRTVARATFRGIDPVRSTPEELVQDFREREPLVPGERYELRVSLSALGHVVRAGHRLQMSILAPNAIPSPIWGFGQSSPPSVNTIFHGDRSPSHLLLPVVRGERALASAPPLGALRNQPYRPAPLDNSHDG